MEQSCTQPIVSIITVTKNCASTIERTLKSVQAVKTFDVQYIVVDGESNDETLSVIGRYRDVVDVLLSEGDSGIYNAMNKGAGLADGQYVLFLNGDDYILPDGFNAAKRLLAESKPEVLICQSEVFSESGERLDMLRLSLWRMYFFNTVPHLSTFVSSVLQRKYTFREQFRIAADYDLFLRLYLNGHHFTVADFVTATHHRGGFSNDRNRAIAEMREIRRDNLGVALYRTSRALEALNGLLNKVILTCGLGPASKL
ncbi:MAG: PGL/p-HBAD biosynthesis glycosyltransferase [Nitrosomonadaceae bacterium]|nr:PGL/p-HBAD biosynthesis glycosyltransferase [Nitrosomonadaceae bacterium]